MNNAQRIASGTQGPNRTDQIRMVAVGKTRLHVAIRSGNGEGVPLLLLNGIGANLEMFDLFVEELDPGLEIIRFDIPGVGGSPAPTFLQSIMAFARLTAKLLDQLGYRQVDVLGISWGGALA